MLKAHTKNSFIRIIKSCGKNPELDWVVMVVLFFLLMITVAVLGIGFLFQTKRFVQDQRSATGIASDSGIKTKEEELRDVLNEYMRKSELHTKILGEANIQVEKIATSTATTTPSAVATTTLATPSTASRTNTPADTNVNTGSEPRASDASDTTLSE